MNLSSVLQQTKAIISKHIVNIYMTLLIIFISMGFGYVLRVHHEDKIHKSYQSQAEKELFILEEEFQSALEKPRKFLIFNGRFEVYPLKESARSFIYKQVKETNIYPLAASLIDHDTKVTNTENRTN